MPGTDHAILIGLNEHQDARFFQPLRFAEKDCADLASVLTDPGISTWLPENVTVLSGAAATTRNIEAALYKTVVKDKGPDDRVLVYFSGHGFIAGDRELAYLGSFDVAIRELLDNPNLGLRMDRVHDDFFMASQARNVLFVLDCCHSGALTPSSIRDSSRDVTRDLVGPEFFSAGSGRMAIVACPPHSVSRESADLRNGIFTHYLIRGLRGEAAEHASGEVTLDSLLAFVRANSPSEQPPGSYGQTYGRMVLSTPGVRGPWRPSAARRGAVSVGQIAPTEVQTLSNPFEPYVPFIRTLVQELADRSRTPQAYLDNAILSALADVSQVECIFLLRAEDGAYTVSSRSHSRAGDQHETEPIGRAHALASRLVEDVLIPNRVLHGVSIVQGGDNDPDSQLVIVPLSTVGTSRDYFVVSGVPAGSHLLDDAYAHLLRAVYNASSQLTCLNPTLIEGAILDHLRENFYGFMPLEVYEGRFRLFKKRLRDMTICFQPVMYLEPGSLHICGWEALARDPETMLAPTDLFEAAQIWGRQFLTELDLHVAQLATSTYRSALGEAQMQRPYEIQELSINAYPSTLMRSAYYDTLASALAESKLSGKVVVEISEKRPLPDEVADIHDFKSRLEEYVAKLRLGFAIDDFGVGYSSIERLASLNPAYVKIDREVLLMNASERAIKFVLDLTSFGRLRPAKVILEGFDGSSSLTLEALYRLGVHYVQGFSIGKVGAKLYRISKEEVQYFESLVRAA